MCIVCPLSSYSLLCINLIFPRVSVFMNLVVVVRLRMFSCLAICLNTMAMIVTCICICLHMCAYMYTLRFCWRRCPRRRPRPRRCGCRSLLLSPYLFLSLYLYPYMSYCLPLYMFMYMALYIYMYHYVFLYMTFLILHSPMHLHISSHIPTYMSWSFSL